MSRRLPMQPGNVEATYTDVADLARLIDFRPATPLRAGLAQFVNWYRVYYGCVDEDVPRHSALTGTAHSAAEGIA